MYPYERYPSMKDMERRWIVKEHRKKEKAKQDVIKKAEAARRRTLSLLEWYILGILSYPFVGPLYHIAINHMNTMVK
jgi:hypothetical protein